VGRRVLVDNWRTVDEGESRSEGAYEMEALSADR
jgi:hypothetical protein